MARLYIKFATMKTVCESEPPATLEAMVRRVAPDRGCHVDEP